MSPSVCGQKRTLLMIKTHYKWRRGGGAVPPPPPGPLVTSKTNIRNVMDFSSNPNVKQIKVVEKFVFKNTTKMHNKSNSTTRNRENY